MLTNCHTHTTYCDGENTPEEIVLSAIEKGFSSIGFSSHGYTPFDLGYCMKDTGGYIEEISQLKRKYRKEIEIYCGVEEDAFSCVDRQCFDYIIGSSHYFNIDGKYYSIDSDYDCFKKCLEVFNYDVIKLSKTYYSNLCDYIKKRKPDIIGHFDLITKFDEIDSQRFLSNAEYINTAQMYIKEVLKSDCIFEVNTGVISRGYRDYPYPCENLLYTIRKEDGKITLSSDSHEISTLSYDFDETKRKLKDIGFKYVYALYNGRFTKDYL